MSQESIERILGKILMHADFRDALISAPDQVLQNFQLTEAERKSLMRMDAESLDFLAASFIERNKSWHIGEEMIP